MLIRKYTTMTAPVSRYWREAATVVLAAPFNNQQSQTTDDYGILMLERSKRQGAFPENLVFPGGVISKEDFAPCWRDMFVKHCHKPAQEIFRPFQERQDKLLVFRNQQTEPLEVPAEVAFRIAVLRECFEECGILLAQTGSYKQQTDKTHTKVLTSKDLNAPNWRKRVHTNAGEFYTLCCSNEVVPDIWCLVEWANWMTPALQRVEGPSLKPRRFDTVFYLACLDHQPETKADKREAVLAEWRSPLDWLDQHNSGVRNMIGPQLYELLRLANFRRLVDLREFSIAREPQGLPRMFPSYFMCADAILSILPGDDLYPADPDYEGRSALREAMSETAEELSRKYPNCNRSVRPLDGTEWKLHSNIKPLCGHINPLGHGHKPSLKGKL